MSFSAVASYANSKSCDPFGQDFDDFSNNELFDQFFDFSPHQEGKASNYLLSDSNLSGVTSLDSFDDHSRQFIQGDFQGESWASPASPQLGHSNFLYSSGRAAISDSELLSLGDITLDSPQISSQQPASMPSTPTLNISANLHRKNRMVEAFSKTFKKMNSSVNKSQVRSPIRKCKSPTTSRVKHNSMEAWTRKIELDASKFNFDLQENALPLSPPPSAKNINAAKFQQTMNRQAIVDLPTAQNMARPTPYDTPLSTPTLNPQYPRTPSHGLTMTPQYQGVSGFWPQMPTTPGFDFQPQAMSPAGIEAPVSWNHESTTPIAQSPPTALRFNSQRASKALPMQLPNNISFNSNELAFDPLNMSSGLGIQMPSTNAQQQSFVVEASPIMSPGYFAPLAQPPHGRLPSRQHCDRAPSGQYPSNMRSHRKNRSISSECNSPPSPNTSSGRLHIRKRKTSKSKSSEAPKTPITPGTVDFVNFTPHDSKKILTGVAPSGSSKTKARREKEALDKRRKLSRAAMRAVEAAGGDVEALVEQGLFV